MAVLKDILYRGFDGRWVLDIGHIGTFILAGHACKSKYRNGLHSLVPRDQSNLVPLCRPAYHRGMKILIAALLTSAALAQTTITVRQATAPVSSSAAAS